MIVLWLLLVILIIGILMKVSVYVLAVLFTGIIVFVAIMGKNKEHFVEGENIYMEPEYNTEFEKCLQAYPIPFRGPINSGWYGCVRQTDDLLKNLGQPCGRCKR